MTERIESARSDRPGRADRPGRGLSERLALTFAILLTTVACLYGVVIVFSVGFTEEELISSFLRDELEQARDDLEGGRIPREAPNTLIFGEGDAERLAPIPPAFRHVREGFTELTESPSAFVWRGAWRGGSLIIVRDQAGFEEKEQALFLVMAGSIILVFLLGAFLGGRLSRRVMRPVEKLSVAVRERTAAGEWKPLPPELLTRDEVGELAQNCSDSMRRLMEALKREKAFTGDASHELRTPLTVIKTSAELLELGSLDPRQREQVARISRAAESMRETIETLLEFARAASRSDLKAPPDSVEGIVAVAASRWREFAEDRGLALEVVREAPCPGAYSPGMLGIVLANLLRNAVAYAPEGFIRITELATGVSVASTGPAIAEAERSRIFEPFARGSSAAASGEKGLLQAGAAGKGLGLSIVARICRRLGWTVHVDALSLEGDNLARFGKKGPPAGLALNVFRIDLVTDAAGVRSDVMGAHGASGESRAASSRTVESREI